MGRESRGLLTEEMSDKQSSYKLIVGNSPDIWENTSPSLKGRIRHLNHNIQYSLHLVLDSCVLKKKITLSRNFSSQILVSLFSWEYFKEEDYGDKI